MLVGRGEVGGGRTKQGKGIKGYKAPVTVQLRSTGSGVSDTVLTRDAAGGAALTGLSAERRTDGRIHTPSVW